MLKVVATDKFLNLSTLSPDRLALNFIRIFSNATLVQPDQSEANVSKVLCVISVASPAPSLPTPASMSAEVSLTPAPNVAS